MVILLEVKRAETAVSLALRYFTRRLAPDESLQLVQTAQRPETVDGIHVRPAADWLDALEV